MLSLDFYLRESDLQIVHMNKQHWNTVTFSDGLADDLWQGWVHHSYERVVAGLPKAKRPQAPQR
ncbi:MmcQ [Aeromonas hydrophila]|nr:MmcQ [Aeromonas hydrophila]